MDSFSDLIDAYGLSTVSAVLGLDESHIRTMKARDSIAPEYWQRLVEGAPEALRRTVTLETFARLRTRRFSKDRAA